MKFKQFVILIYIIKNCKIFILQIIFDLCEKFGIKFLHTIQTFVILVSDWFAFKLFYIVNYSYCKEFIN